MSVYIQANILIAMAWVVFQLLPLARVKFRTAKVIAQTLLLSSLFVVPVVSSLPDFSFPELSEKVKVGKTVDVDSASIEGTPAKRAVESVNQAIAIAPRAANSNFPILFWAFGLGAIVMAARRVWMWLQLTKILRATIPLHQIGRTHVAISDAIAIPFSVLHFRTAYVVLPAELVPFREDFRIALRHEIEHHRRRDTVWAVGLEWLICGFYLNPAIYLWRKTILNLQELACDEALISRMRIPKHAYGSCLLRVAEMALGRRFMYAGTACMIPASESNSHSFLTRRIKMFAQHERSKARKALSLTIGTMSCLLIGASAYIAQAAIRSNHVNPGKPVFDQRVQSITEDVLQKGIAQHKASAGFAIVADPMTGKILAAVGINNGYDKNMKGDWALSYPIQPASALKPLVVASALQNYFVKIDDVHDCENGTYTFGSTMIKDAEPWDKLTTAETVAQSSNICTVKIAQMMGAKSLHDGLIDFGLGGAGALSDYPGARAGQVPSLGKVSDDIFIAMTALGTSMKTDFYVTPLEVVQAYGAIANGGRLMKAITPNQTPEVVRAVLSLDAANKMRETLRKVVTEGTAQSIKGSPITLAGKTGTSIVNGKSVTSFVGMAPADHPSLVAYVVVFEPKGKQTFGGRIAAPIFQRLVEKLL